MAMAAQKAALLTQRPPNNLSLQYGEYALLFASAIRSVPEPNRTTCKTAAIKLLVDFKQVWTAISAHLYVIHSTGLRQYGWSIATSKLLRLSVGSTGVTDPWCADWDRNVLSRYTSALDWVECIFRHYILVSLSSGLITRCTNWVLPVMTHGETGTDFSGQAWVCTLWRTVQG